jgi:hypothetical protein
VRKELTLVLNVAVDHGDYPQVDYPTAEGMYLHLRSMPARLDVGDGGTVVRPTFRLLNDVDQTGADMTNRR